MRRRKLRHTHTGSTRVRTEETLGGCSHRAKEHPGLMPRSEARERWPRPPPGVSEGAQRWWHLDLRLRASRTGREDILVVFSHSGCGHLLTAAWEDETSWPLSNVVLTVRVHLTADIFLNKYMLQSKAHSCSNCGHGTTYTDSQL